MKTWLNLANILALLLIMVSLAITYKQMDIYNEQYNEQRLRTASEYAAEAAFADSVIPAENDTTYQEIAANIITEKTLKTFSRLMEFNYDMYRNETSDVNIENSIAVMCLIANDGYYITDMVPVKDISNPGTAYGKRLAWSPKLPYSGRYTEGDGKIYTYGVTLASGKWWRVEDGRNNVTEGLGYSSDKTMLTRSMADSFVSTTLTNALASRLSEGNYMERSGSSDYTVYIPSTDIYNGINSIDSPSLMVVLNNAGYSHYDGTCSTMVGLTVTWKPRILGFVENGIYKYCYEGQRNTEDLSGVSYFNSIREAAKLGYEPDIVALANPAKRLFD